MTHLQVKTLMIDEKAQEFQSCTVFDFANQPNNDCKLLPDA